MPLQSLKSKKALTETTAEVLAIFKGDTVLS